MINRKLEVLATESEQELFDTVVAELGARAHGQGDEQIEMSLEDWCADIAHGMGGVCTFEENRLIFDFSRRYAVLAERKRWEL